MYRIDKKLTLCSRLKHKFDKLVRYVKCVNGVLLTKTSTTAEVHQILHG